MTNDKPDPAFGVDDAWYARFNEDGTISGADKLPPITSMFDELRKRIIQENGIPPEYFGYNLRTDLRFTHGSAEDIAKQEVNAAYNAGVEWDGPSARERIARERYANDRMRRPVPMPEVQHRDPITGKWPNADQITRLDPKTGEYVPLADPIDGERLYSAILGTFRQLREHGLLVSAVFISKAGQKAIATSYEWRALGEAGIKPSVDGYALERMPERYADQAIIVVKRGGYYTVNERGDVTKVEREFEG